MKYSDGLLLLTLLSTFWACQPEVQENLDNGPVRITISHKASGQPLLLNQPINNPHGEPITITSFSYYLSNFSLITTSGATVNVAENYFLVDEKKPDSRSFTFSAPAGSYKAIRMMIGVDSTRNVSGVQTGALDPVNGMFWSWNTGYIFAKLEGKSIISAAPLQNVTYHIGGFRQGENAMQMVQLDLPVPLNVVQGGHGEIELSASIEAWFAGAHNITIASEAFSMTPGPLAVKLSENYARMFKVEAVNN